MNNPISIVRLNNLQYNANRDPQVYRRLANEKFKLQVDLKGQGTAKVTFAADNNVIEETEISLPGRFETEFSFDSPGIRVGTLTVNCDGNDFTQRIRLDVLDHAWIG